MLSEEEVKKLLDELRNFKDEIAVLKKKLNTVNKQKEDWFSKKADVGNQIKEKITEVKNLKKKRNELTNKVKDLKKQRNELNTKISSNIKTIIEKKKDAVPVFERGKRISPRKIKAEIDALEQKIETQPMKFDAEQRMMKKVKSLKKQLKEMGGLDDSKKSLGVISKETDKFKKSANQLHKTLQDTAKESQELHEKLIEISKKIDDLKKQEEESYQKFFDHKKEFTNLNNELKDKLKSMQEIKTKLDENKVELSAETHKKQQKTLKQKTKEVEEKISKKKKLTTEDLLIMQRQ